jgi:uncharacterized protein YigA (DUF484 family)
MESKDIALYLQNNPNFFEDYADMLADISIPHPYSGRTISLGERQLLVLREQNKNLERRLSELMQIAEGNNVLQKKVHQFTLALFGTRDLASLQTIITQNLHDIFLVAHTVLHLWKDFPPSSEVLAFVDNQMHPVCSHHALHDTLPWFHVSPEISLRSFAYLPLHTNGQSIGLLILASEDAQRFYPDMGTLHLQVIAEVASCALDSSL